MAAPKVDPRSGALRYPLDVPGGGPSMARAAALRIRAEEPTFYQTYFGRIIVVRSIRKSSTRSSFTLHAMR